MPSQKRRAQQTARELKHADHWLPDDEEDDDSMAPVEDDDEGECDD